MLLCSRPAPPCRPAGGTPALFGDGRAATISCDPETVSNDLGQVGATPASPEVGGADTDNNHRGPAERVEEVVVTGADHDESRQHRIRRPQDPHRPTAGVDSDKTA
jgi:hypothetical protein